jgi:hypothetical protein
VSFANVSSWTARVGENRGKEVLEAIRPETGENLGNTLSGTLLIDTARGYLEHRHEGVDKIGEVVLSETFDESSERFRGGRSGFRNGIDEDFTNERDKLREVGYKILCFGERREVADDGR